MAKAVVINAGEAKFLVETDELVEVPEEFSPPKVEGVPDGLTPVVDLKGVERKFSEVKALIIGCCNELSDTISKIKPDKFAVELGIKFAGETGIPMLAKGSAEATLKVSIEWQSD